MSFIIPNLRLGELVGVVNANKPYFDDFVEYLIGRGYADLYQFVAEENAEAAFLLILGYIRKPARSASVSKEIHLFDGLGRPYADAKQSRWYLLAWLFRDAPAQRLQPLVRTAGGSTLDERRANLLNELRAFVKPLFPNPESWTWAAISDVMIARLEGSRRSLKGTLFEGVVRSTLYKLFEEKKVQLKIADRQVTLNEETYHVRVSGTKTSLLIPVKTRETMGGGHANLFTRDIHKAIDVAHKNGSECIPVVIAESWSGDLNSLKCENYIYIYIYIQANPNQILSITPLLEKRLRDLLPVFKALE